MSSESSLSRPFSLSCVCSPHVQPSAPPCSSLGFCFSDERGQDLRSSPEEAEMFMSSTSEIWKLGPRSVLCVGKNCKKWGGGTMLVSSWSEFSTKARELPPPPPPHPFHLQKKQKKWQLQQWDTWGSSPRSSEAAHQYGIPVLHRGPTCCAWSSWGDRAAWPAWGHGGHVVPTGVPTLGLWVTHRSPCASMKFSILCCTWSFGEYLNVSAEMSAPVISSYPTGPHVL